MYGFLESRSRIICPNKPLTHANLHQIISMEKTPSVK